MNQPQMKRKGTKGDTESRIVEAAVHLFAQQGYKGTSTRDIAHLAKVNEATLFRYFGRKTDLFVAAAESELSQVKLGRELQSGLADDEEIAVVVPLIVQFLVDTLLKKPDLVRLLYVANFELPGSTQMLRDHLGPIFDLINSYFERCASKGVIRCAEPSIATLGLAGVVSAHQNLHRLFTGQELNRTAEEAAPIYTQFLLNAISRPAAGENVD